MSRTKATSTKATSAKTTKGRFILPDGSMFLFRKDNGSWDVISTSDAQLLLEQSGHDLTKVLPDLHNGFPVVLSDGSRIKIQKLGPNNPSVPEPEPKAKETPKPKATPKAKETPEETPKPKATPKATPKKATPKLPSNLEFTSQVEHGKNSSGPGWTWVYFKRDLREHLTPTQREMLTQALGWKFSAHRTRIHGGSVYRIENKALSFDEIVCAISDAVSQSQSQEVTTHESLQNTGTVTATTDQPSYRSVTDQQAKPTSQKSTKVAQETQATLEKAVSLDDMSNRQVIKQLAEVMRSMACVLDAIASTH